MVPNAHAVMDQMAAFGYGLAYDAVVRGFRPYDELLEEVVACIGRAAPVGLPPAFHPRARRGVWNGDPGPTPGPGGLRGDGDR